jgi:hypothetical protein
MNSPSIFLAAKLSVAIPALRLGWNGEARHKTELGRNSALSFVAPISHQNSEHTGEEHMKKQAAEMAQRIERAVRSGKLSLDSSYTIPKLAEIIGTARAQLSRAVNREFGSVALFCTQVGFGPKKAVAVTVI